MNKQQISKMGRTREAVKSLKLSINYLLKKKCLKIILGCTELPIAILLLNLLKKLKLSKTFWIQIWY